MKCKRCDNTKLVDSTEIVQDLDWDKYTEVEAKKCTECGCIHFELNGYEVAEFATKDQIDTFDTATYTKSDYNVAIEHKK